MRAGGEYQPRWFPLDGVDQSFGMPLLPGWLGLKKDAAVHRAKYEQAHRERRQWLEPLARAWNARREELVAQGVLTPEVVELLEAGDVAERVSRALGLLAPHWRWLILTSCPSCRPGQVVTFQEWTTRLVGLLTELVPGGTSTGSIPLQAAESLAGFLPALREAGWLYYDGREHRSDVLVIASIDQPPTPGIAVSVRARRWSLDQEALRLLGAHSDDVLIEMSPPPSVLPPPVRPPKPKKVSGIGRRFDAELRATGSVRVPEAVPRRAPSVVPPPGVARNFVEWIALGVQSNRERSPF